MMIFSPIILTLCGTFFSSSWVNVEGAKNTSHNPEKKNVKHENDEAHRAVLKQVLLVLSFLLSPEN